MIKSADLFVFDDSDVELKFPQAGGPSRARGRIRTFAIVLMVVAAATASAGPAQAARQRGKPARIAVLAPAAGKRTSSSSVEVRVKVSTAADFRATVAGRDVSRRFHRHGDLLEARLRRGRDFRLGVNYLLLAAGRGSMRRARTVVFVARRRAPSLLSVTGGLRPRAGTPLRVRLRVGHAVSRLGLTLNGRRLRLGPVAGRRSWLLTLGADDGLRFGHNTLTATAERTAAGLFDRGRLRFFVPRSAPLVGAGPDRVTQMGRSVILDGRATRGASHRGSLAYRWKIVAKPPRSRARIVDSTSKVARLLPDLPGSYRVRLVAGPATAKAKAAEQQAAAHASSAPAATPTCLTGLGGSGNAPAAAEEPTGPFDALSPPTCVTPTGDTSTPPLPAEASSAAAADEVAVTAMATQSPMGWPIETIAADGSIRVGPQIYPKASGWAHLLVLNQQSLQPEAGAWGSGSQVFSLANAAALAQTVEKTNNRVIVVISGMGQAQSESPKAAQEALAKSVEALGAAPGPVAPAAVKSGNWSVIGTLGEPGRTDTNLHGLTEAPPAESAIGSLPGSINGYLQLILADAFSYVSPEFLSIDTRAPGSSNTVSVFKVGEETLRSESIPNGSLALHIAVLGTEAPNGEPTQLSNATYVIDQPYVTTDQAGVKAAAEDLQRWRQAAGDDLIVMQTFGEEAVSSDTAPIASADWVNDGLLHPTGSGLWEWNGQPYVSAKNPTELTRLLDQMWNPGYPTVAGQVGDLTGQAGHDLVANLGAGNPGAEVTRLTMVASNHPENPTANYVSGHPAPAEGRLVGTLVRNGEAGWSVQSGVPTGAFGATSVWKTAFAAPTAWPDSESGEDKAAMAYIAHRIWPGEGITDVREEYVRRESADWEAIRGELLEVRYEATNAYSEATFKALQAQLATEMRDVSAVKDTIGEWQKIFGDSSFSGYVKLNELSATIVDNAVQDSQLRETEDAEVDPLEIISQSLYVAGDLLGFPEVTEELKVAQSIGAIAGAFGIAALATPQESPAEPRSPDTSKIVDRADRLGGDLTKRFEQTSDTLGHLTEIFLGDWGKLQAASAAAKGSWAFGGETEKLIRQSLAVTASRQLYQGLLPLTYREWVVSPYVTVSNGDGPLPPGNSYQCIDYRPAYESNTIRRPFGAEPAGALSLSNYRPSQAPGSTAPPAQPYSTPYTLRALKSKQDDLELHRVEYEENREALTVENDGANPPKSLVDPLFEAVNPGEQNPDFPVSLGMNKPEFFADFAGGAPTWSRMICAQE